LEVKDLTIQVLNPGRINSTHFFNEFSEKWNARKSNQFYALSPEKVAQMILATVNTNFDVDVGLDAILMRFVYWLFPAPLLDAAMKKNAIADPPC
jgi:short-subunit dehydrogenase